VTRAVAQARTLANPFSLSPNMRARVGLMEKPFVKVRAGTILPHELSLTKRLDLATGTVVTTPIV
jgi:hypothetical protein